jgi:hypothetical protein
MLTTFLFVIEDSIDTNRLSISTGSFPIALSRSLTSQDVFHTIPVLHSSLPIG